MKYHLSGKLSITCEKLDKKKQKQNVDTPNTNPKGVTDVANVDGVPCRHTQQDALDTTYVPSWSAEEWLQDALPDGGLSQPGL